MQSSMQWNIVYSCIWLSSQNLHSEAVYLEQLLVVPHFKVDVWGFVFVFFL